MIINYLVGVGLFIIMNSYPYHKQKLWLTSLFYSSLILGLMGKLLKFDSNTIIQNS